MYHTFCDTTITDACYAVKITVCYPNCICMFNVLLADCSVCDMNS